MDGLICYKFFFGIILSDGNGCRKRESLRCVGKLDAGTFSSRNLYFPAQTPVEAWICFTKINTKSILSNAENI